MAGERLGSASAVRSSALSIGRASVFGSSREATRAFGLVLPRIGLGSGPSAFESIKAFGNLPNKLTIRGEDAGRGRPKSPDSAFKSVRPISFSNIPEVGRDYAQPKILSKTGTIRFAEPAPRIVPVFIERVVKHEVVPVLNPAIAQPEVRVAPYIQRTLEQQINRSSIQQHALAEGLRAALARLVGGTTRLAPSEKTHTAELQNPIQVQKMEMVVKSPSKIATDQAEAKSKPQKTDPARTRVESILPSGRQRRRLTRLLPINRDHEMNSKREDALNEALTKTEGNGQIEAEKLIDKAGILGDAYKSRVQIRRDGSQVRIARDLGRAGQINRELIKAIVSDHTAIKVGEKGLDEATPREIREVLVLPDELFEATVSPEIVLRRQVIKEEVAPEVGALSDLSLKIGGMSIEQIVDSPNIPTVELLPPIDPTLMLPDFLDSRVHNSNVVNIATIRRELVLAA